MDMVSQLHCYLINDSLIIKSDHYDVDGEQEGTKYVGFLRLLER